MTATALLELRALLDDRLSTAGDVRDEHGRDQSALDAAPPDAVAFATSTEEVAAILRICTEHRLPVVPFGGGSSLEGHVLATSGGLALDLTGMRAVLEVSPDDLDCRVQAGLTWRALNEHLAHTGLFFAVNPGADATLGGMVATGASGSNAVRYGTMRENVLGLTVVLADGEIMRTGTRARKSSAGYDLTRLLIGSEGTLGVVTEVGLRLVAQPEAVSAAVCQFADLRGATRTVVETIQRGVPMARMELLDDVGMGGVIAYSGLEGFERAPTLFLEFIGTRDGVAEQIERVAEIAAVHGGTGFRHASTEEDRERLWQARYDVFWACQALRPEARGISTDVCVPISALADCVLATRADIDEAGLVAPLVGHAGDGNFHLLILVDPQDPEEVERGETVHARMVPSRRRHGRHLHRGARGRRRQDPPPRAPAPGRCSCDATYQGRAGPARHPEPREGAACHAALKARRPHHVRVSPR